MGSHFKDVKSNGDKGSTLKSTIDAAADEAGLPRPVAAAFYPLWWAREHRWKVLGGLLVAVGLVLSIWTSHDVRGYLMAERKVETDAQLVSSVENEYYVRSSKTYESYYQNTYQFYVDDEPNEWTERSDYPGDETRHLTLWMDADGKWHRFELGRSLIACIGAIVVGVLLLIFA